jgi:hypothetical protein
MAAVVANAIRKAIKGIATNLNSADCDPMMMIVREI